MSVAALGSATALSVPSAPCFAAQAEMLREGSCWCAAAQHSPGCGAGDACNEGRWLRWKGPAGGKDVSQFLNLFRVV